MTLRSSAFTLLETIVVVAIMAAVAGFSVLYAQTDTVRMDLRTQVGIFASYLREMQTDAASGKGSTGAGIHLEADRYVLFHGSSYDANDSANFVVELPGSLQIENVSLIGGGTTILFTGPLGETAEYGTVDFASDQIGQSVRVTVHSLGSVDYE